MEQQMTAEREKRAAILRSEGERDSQVNAARGRAEALLLDAEAQAKQQTLLAQARADAASRLAEAMHRPTPRPPRRCVCCWPATGWPWASRWPMRLEAVC
jgi:hypothetical protein